MNERLFLGVLISLLYGEMTGLSPGGIIVPAYFALYLTDPLRMLCTVLLALFTWAILQLFSRHMILYGKRRFAMFILTGMLLKTIFGVLYETDLLPFINLAQSIGYLVPGLLARDMDRQGILSTGLSLGIVTVFLWIAQILLWR